MDILEKLISTINVNISFTEITKNPLFIVDFLIVLLIIYWFYKLLKNTRAVRIFYGFVFLFIAMFLSSIFHLYILNWVLRIMLTVLLVAIPVVFQPELRNTLEKIGRTGFKAKSFKDITTQEFLNSILGAIAKMIVNKIGGIIVIQRKTGLGEYIETGVILDALISKELIISCFNDDSPLHDGAMIISNGKISGASCVFPLSENNSLSGLGTRHKAGVGLSEQTDAVVIIISGKNGNISLAVDGVILENIHFNDLENKLRKIFIDDNSKKMGISNYFRIGQ